MAGWVSLKAVQNLSREWDGFPEGYGFETLEDVLKVLEVPTSRWSNYSESRRRVTEVLVFQQPDGTRKVRLISRHEGRWYLDWPQPPYRLFDREVIRRAHRVLVCDDEEAATCAGTMGLGAATTSLSGLAWISRSDWSPLADKDVVILPRHDPDGANYADQVAQRARTAGACSVKIVAIPDLAAGENLVDWLNRAPDEEPRNELIETLQRLIAETPECEKRPTKILEHSAERPQCLSDVTSKKLAWIMPDVIPAAALTLITGNAGIGKSLCMLDIAARVTRGETIVPESFPLRSLDGEQLSEGDSAGVCLNSERAMEPGPPSTTNVLSSTSSPGAVLLCVYAETLATTVQPRLVASGADLSQVYALPLPTTEDDTLPSNGRTSSASEQLAWSLEQELIRLNDQGTACRLVIIDPFFISAQSPAAEAAEALFVERLTRLAARFGPAVVLISATNHFSHRMSLRRQTRGGELLLNTIGSMWNLARNDANRQCRWLVPVKTNFCETPPGLGILIQDGQVRWYRDDAPSGERPRHACHDSGPPKSELEQAIEWLQITLSAGRIRSTEIKEEGLQSGFSRSTLFRAFRLVKGRAIKDKGTGHWFWQLPEEVFEMPLSRRPIN